MSRTHPDEAIKKKRRPTRYIKTNKENIEKSAC